MILLTDEFSLLFEVMAMSDYNKWLLLLSEIKIVY